MPQTDRCRVFRELHEEGCFVLPNPWDVGSARQLVRLGFKALATTSAGFAWTLGRRDTHVTLDEALAHFRAIASAVAVPVNADFQGAFAVDPHRVREHVAAATRTGVAGLSVEDSTGDPAQPLFDFELAVDRVKAARQAIDESSTSVLLTARSEGFIVGRPDLDETVRRLTAFAEAGADCLYAPGLRTLAEVSAVVEAMAPRPVNVLANAALGSVGDIAATGARRISVGGALARAAWSGFFAAAREIAERGTFGKLADAVGFAELDHSFPEGRP